MKRLDGAGGLATGTDAYTLGEMMDDLRERCLVRGLRAVEATDAFRRNLQRAYVARMAALMEDEDALATDIVPFVRGEMRTLRDLLANADTNHRPTQLHYEDIVARIDALMDG
jgi:hypothetical protein